MAHKVDLKLAERRISQSLHSKMLHLEDAACAIGPDEEGVGGRGGCQEYRICMRTALSKRR